MIVLKKIREKRKAKGFSQKQMAELLNISQPGYQKIEQGTNVVSIERFLEICRILEIDSYNDLLPAVNAEIVEEIEKVLLAGSMAFDNIRNNANYSRKLLYEIIEKVKNDSIDKPTLIEDLEFIENYLSIIRKEGFNQEFQFNRIRELLEKID
jgi:transcriptional regulator with XRE-family HTH domain